MIQLNCADWDRLAGGKGNAEIRFNWVDTLACCVHADSIARWDGSDWYPVGIGLDDNVYALALSGPNLIAGGAFLDAGNKPNADYIACWGYIYQYVYLPLVTKN